MPRPNTQSSLQLDGQIKAICCTGKTWALAGLLLSVAAPPLFAQERNIDEVIVVGDPVGLMEERETDSVFGVNRSLVETPRSVSIVSDTTMDRYSIEDIDDFITTTPGTYGGSFFGVPGAISVRGRIGDNYFRGFKRITNNGFFPLPVGASERVEIVRGPTPAIYGAGRVGGLLNFYPKTTFGEGMSADDGISGYISYTGGSYDKNNVTGEINIPFLLGGRETGVSLYAEVEDSKSFYRGREPEHKLIQAGFNHDLDNGFSVEFGAMYFESEGYNQTPGWNRLTQDLIDNGTYITGRDTDLVDLDGSGHITRNELDAELPVFFDLVSCITQFVEFPGGCNALPPTFAFVPVTPPTPGTPFDLDTGVGTTQLSRRDVVLSERDIWESENITLYFDLIKEFDNNSTLKLQLFYDDQDAKGALTTGFAAHHIMDAFEVRGSYEFGLELSEQVDLDVYVTASHRIYDSRLNENFLAGYLVLDRQDLSVGATANDIFDNPFSQESGGINAPWDSAYDTEWKDTGVALVTDFHLWENLGILLNGRYDHYEYEAINNGTVSFSQATDPLGVLTEGEEDEFSWSASISYTTPVGIVPYVTYAEAADPLINSNGGVSPSTILRGTILGESELIEAGIKFSVLDDTLYGTLAYFDQERTETDGRGNVLLESTDGFEAELNYVITDNWALTGAATISEVKVADPDPDNCAFNPATFSLEGGGEFLNLPPTSPVFGGLTGQQAYGGIFGALNASCAPGLADGYKRTTVPDEVYSLFVTYTSPETDFGTFGATFGGTYVSETQTLGGGVTFPDYTVFRLAAFAEIGRFNITATVDNLFDEDYFQPVQGVFQNVSALPGKGRIWRLTGKFNF